MKRLMFKIKMFNFTYAPTRSQRSRKSVKISPKNVIFKFIFSVFLNSFCDVGNIATDINTYCICIALVRSLPVTMP